LNEGLKSQIMIVVSAIHQHFKRLINNEIPPQTLL